MKEGGAGQGHDNSLREACEGFEAIFVAQLLGSAEGQMGQGMLGGDVADKVFRAQFNDALAGAVAKRGALGIADMVYEELKGRTESESKSERTTDGRRTPIGMERRR